VLDVHVRRFLSDGGAVAAALAAVPSFYESVATKAGPASRSGELPVDGG
jgi:hypothetical protein